MPTKLEKLKAFEGVDIKALAPGFPAHRRERVGRLFFKATTYSYEWVESGELRSSGGYNKSMTVVDENTIHLIGGIGFKNEGAVIVTYTKV